MTSADRIATNRIAVGRLDRSASADARLVEQLATLVNDVYAVAEAGLWLDGTTRTNPTDVAALIARSEIAVARTADAAIVGCVRVHDIADDTSELGILVAAPAVRGTGVGRALLDFVEQDAHDRGLRAVQLELLVPRGWQHPEKELLKELYGRRGFRLIHTTSMDDSYPDLTPLLAAPCDLQIRRKDLA